MSCIGSTAPIDISPKNISGNCTSKCKYSINYQSTVNTVITNNGDYISLSYDNSKGTPVKYNDNQYNVTEIRLYFPSLHSFSGKKSVGEMIIVHNSSVTSTTLLVCIPIHISSTETVASQLLENIIKTCTTYIPSEGETYNATFNNFNLRTFIPQKPFYTYNATLPYQPCSSNADYIVFPNLLGNNIDISKITAKSLLTIITKNVYLVQSGPNLFYNKNGPSNDSISDDDIYIDCQPVGQSEEQTQVVVSNNNSPTMSINDLFKNSAFLSFFIILVVIFAVFLFVALTRMIGLVLSNNSGAYDKSTSK